MAVVDFPVSAARSCEAGGLCAYETPLDPLTEGEFRRPSHCDVVVAKVISDDEEQKAHRDVFFNKIVELGKQTMAEEVKDCDLRQFLPEVVLKELESE